MRKQCWVDQSSCTAGYGYTDDVEWAKLIRRTAW